MARVKNEKDLLLRKRARRRLVGSIVLVIVAIIVLPMILERAPKQERKEVDIIIPSENLPDESSTVVTREGIVSDTDPNSTNVDSGTQVKDAKTKSSNEVITEEEQIIESKPELLAKPIQRKKDQSGKAEVSEVGSKNNRQNKDSVAITIVKFVVQLGAFSDLKKAKHQQHSLASNGIKKVYTETVRNKNKEVTRVRIGPFSTREAAEKEQKKLRKLGVNGVIMSK